MRACVVMAAAGMLGCGGGDGQPAPPDAMPPAPPGCVQNDVRATATVTVSGVVTDFATGDPVDGAQVEVLTAWDVDGNFPEGCPAMATLTTANDGRFGPVTIQTGSSLEPPIGLFLVTGAGRAPTASDVRHNACTAGDCGNTFHGIAAPTQALADAWRAELAAGGMPDALTRGLVAFEYRELGGGGAADVVPFEGTAVPRDLVPGVEVRFVEADRETLAPAGQASTLAAGLALAGLDVQDNATYLGGRRGMDTWSGLGVLVADGWIFLEDKLRTP